MVQSEIGSKGITDSLVIPTAAGLVPQERNLNMLQRVNIECNSGILKDIWCHRSMYYYVWIYKYIFSVPLPFIVDYGEVLVVFMKSNVGNAKYTFLLDKLLTHLVNVYFSGVYLSCTNMSALLRLIGKMLFKNMSHTVVLVDFHWMI